MPFINPSKQLTHRNYSFYKGILFIQLYPYHFIIYTIYVHVYCQKISNLFLRGLETDRKESLCRALLVCFAQVQTSLIFHRQCTYIVFILQCQMQNKIQYRYNTKYKKKMKIPKRESEAVNRRTDITMAGRKKNDKRSNKDNVSCVLRFFKMGFGIVPTVCYFFSVFIFHLNTIKK